MTDPMTTALEEVAAHNVPTLANRLHAVFADDWANESEADAIAVCAAFGATFAAPLIEGFDFAATFPDGSKALVATSAYCPLND